MSNPKIDPNLVYEAMTSAQTPAGSFKKGDRLRGSNPTVVGAAQFFVPEGLSDEEVEKIWRERFPTALHLPGAR